ATGRPFTVVSMAIFWGSPSAFAGMGALLGSSTTVPHRAADVLHELVEDLVGPAAHRYGAEGRQPPEDLDVRRDLQAGGRIAFGDDGCDQLAPDARLAALVVTGDLGGHLPLRRVLADIDRQRHL